MPFLGQWLKRVRHAETEKNKRKKTKAIRPWLESCSKRAIRLSWEKNNWELQLEEAQSVWKIVRNTVRVWESENKKKRYFFLLQLHVRKINGLSSHEIFEWCNYGKLEYSEEDFATDFMMRIIFTFWDLFAIYLIYCRLKFSINLIIVISIS